MDLRVDRYLSLFLLLALVLPMPFGCSKAGEDAEAVSEPADMVAVPFSLSVSNVRTSTKMTDGVVQDNSFRGIGEVIMIPFKITGSKIAATDSPWDSNIALPDDGFTDAVHLYETVHVHLGTNAVLAFGKATDEAVTVSDGDSLAFMQRNGVLRHTGLWNIGGPSEINFYLEPIANISSAGTALETWHSGVVSYLNTILNSSVTRTANGASVTYKFNDMGSYNNHPGLVEALQDFTCMGKILPGSAEVLGYLLTNLYRAVYYYAADGMRSVDYHNGNFFYVYQLSNTILNKIKNNNYVAVSGSGATTTITLKQNAPGCYGLPHGIYPIQYREKLAGYGTGTFTGTVASPSGIWTPSYGDICFPPALWYRANSELATTSDDGAEDYFTSGTSSWAEILSNFDSSFIKTDTKVAAMRNPLQYSVARLILKINKTSSATLQDSRGNAVSVNGTNAGRFPLTAIVLADQKTVDYEFMPVLASGNKYIYDTDVYNGTSPKAYISYSTTSKNVSVLALQTETASDVHFALEFLNNTTTTFYGAGGCVIYPGCHFYLAGAMEYGTAQNPNGAPLTSVFTQDYATELSVSIPDFRNAYSILPELRDPQLVLGVEAEMRWAMITPGTIVIK